MTGSSQELLSYPPDPSLSPGSSVEASLPVSQHWAPPRPPPAPSILPGEGGASAGKPTLVAGHGGQCGAAPNCLTLAAGGLGACMGGGLCGPAVWLCRGGLGGRLHLFTALRLLGREAGTLCPSCQLFSLCGDTGRLWVTSSSSARTRDPPSHALGHPQESCTEAAGHLYGVACGPAEAPLTPGWFPPTPIGMYLTQCRSVTPAYRNGTNKRGFGLGPQTKPTIQDRSGWSGMLAPCPSARLYLPGQGTGTGTHAKAWMGPREKDCTMATSQAISQQQSACAQSSQALPPPCPPPRLHPGLSIVWVDMLLSSF